MTEFEKRMKEAVEGSSYNYSELKTFDDTESELTKLAAQAASTDLDDALAVREVMLDIQAVARAHEVIAEQESGNFDDPTIEAVVSEK
ncbi:hypothetical protein LRP52_24005 [Photobacterium sp. ZSDE20]|uniref:Uncharacterized protein n=1 Tax=Photobacterium pectinilyticum TaxID=2906793 RepID=A0ABT1N0W7_9GAMM|nr:hypothetical protein [Photobacterium sp. ZSDE20]MCQ1058378.1 hypothetical protein [Photobacterium sp. ZSDE20]MDD1825259.1 hypothetical protein [Photobacterium sp. ZSDE20]